MLRRLRLLPLAFAPVLLSLEFLSSRLFSLRCYFFLCVLSPAGFSAPRILSPSLCHLADPDLLLRVLALPLLLLSAPPFSVGSCLSASPLYAIFSAGTGFPSGALPLGALSRFSSVCLHSLIPPSPSLV